MSNIQNYNKRVRLTKEGLSRFGQQYRDKPFRITDLINGFQILELDHDKKDCDNVLYQLYDRSVNIEGQPSIFKIGWYQYPNFENNHNNCEYFQCD
jgi:hypothetical protein